MSKIGMIELQAAVDWVYRYGLDEGLVNDPSPPTEQVVNEWKLAGWQAGRIPDLKLVPDNQGLAMLVEFGIAVGLVLERGMHKELMKEETS